MWRARLYYDTGFNSINVPDSESTLVKASGNIRTFNTMDILQRYFLSKVTIRAFEDDVINADYLKIYDENNESKYAFYSINGYTMTSGDVVDLAVVMDPLLCCGGIENIDFTDGMTRRHHVSKDDFGAYQEDDPLLIPTRVYCSQAGGYGDMTDEMVIIAVSNYEIYDDSKIECNNNRHLSIIPTGEDSYSIESKTNMLDNLMNDSPIFKITPKRIPNSGTVMITRTPYGIEALGNAVSTSYGDVYHIFKCKPVYSLDARYDYLGKFMEKVNELIEYGRDNIIKSVYLVPMRLMQSQGYGNFSNSQGIWISGAADELNPVEEGPFKEISNNLVSHIRFDNGYGTILDPVRKYYDATYTDLMYINQKHIREEDVSQIYKDVEIHNNRVFYGKHFSYTFTSPTSGEKCTINPELLNDHPTGALPINPPQENFPYIEFTVDIRENGKPTFYIYTKGDGSVKPPGTPLVTNTYRRIPKYKINGAAWPTMSISTMAARNYRLNKDNYLFNAEASALKSAMQMYHDIEPMGDSTAFTAIPDALKGLNNSLRLAYNDDSLIGSYVGAQSRVGFATPIINSALVDSTTSGNSLALNIANREIEKAAEREKFITANLPQVEVISKSSGDGVVVPNGLLIYRNYIDTEDAKKFDRILNQFGYKITEPMRKEFLGNRLGYNYVEISGAAVVAKNVPKSVRKDLANLFSTGVRIWHKKPDYNYDLLNGVNIHFNEEEVNNNE